MAGRTRITDRRGLVAVVDDTTVVVGPTVVDGTTVVDGRTVVVGPTVVDGRMVVVGPTAADGMTVVDGRTVAVDPRVVVGSAGVDSSPLDPGRRASTVIATEVVGTADSSVGVGPLPDTVIGPLVADVEGASAGSSEAPSVEPSRAVARGFDAGSPSPLAVVGPPE